jgi:hypothetical protein
MRAKATAKSAAKKGVKGDTKGKKGAAIPIPDLQPVPEARTPLQVSFRSYFV